MSCNRFVLLSGADYPIASNQEISRFFARHPNREFIRGFAIRDAGRPQLWRIRGRHFRELAPRYSWLRPPLFAVESGLRLFPRRLPAKPFLFVGHNGGRSLAPALSFASILHAQIETWLDCSRQHSRLTRCSSTPSFTTRSSLGKLTSLNRSSMTSSGAGAFDLCESPLPAEQLDLHPRRCARGVEWKSSAALRTKILERQIVFSNGSHR